MEKDSSALGFLKATLKLKGAKKAVNVALKKGKKFEKAIAPNLKKSVANQYTTALKGEAAVKETMKQEATGFFGMKGMHGRMYQKFSKPVLKRGRGRPMKDPKLKKGAPKQTVGRVDKTKATSEGGIVPVETTTGTPLSKKYPLKGMAIGGVGGYVGGKFLQSGGEEQNYYQGYPVKYASVGSSVGKLLKGVGKMITNKKDITIGKYILGAGVVGGGTGYVSARLTDNHTKADHGRKKTAADMTPKEKADQKYAIAKSYENEGHPRKAKEYKSKAARAYKTAWEKKGELNKEALNPKTYQNYISKVVKGFETAEKKVLALPKGEKRIQEATKLIKSEDKLGKRVYDFVGGGDHYVSINKFRDRHKMLAKAIGGNPQNAGAITERSKRISMFGKPSRMSPNSLKSVESKDKYIDKYF